MSEPTETSARSLNAAFADNWRISHERDEARRERDIALAERDKAVAERDEARAHRDAHYEDALTHQARARRAWADRDAVRREQIRDAGRIAAVEDLARWWAAGTSADHAHGPQYAAELRHVLAGRPAAPASGTGRSAPPAAIRREYRPYSRWSPNAGDEPPCGKCWGPADDPVHSFADFAGAKPDSDVKPAAVRPLGEPPLDDPLAQRIRQAIYDEAATWGEDFDAGPGHVVSVADAAVVAARFFDREIAADLRDLVAAGSAAPAATPPAATWTALDVFRIRASAAVRHARLLALAEGEDPVEIERARVIAEWVTGVVLGMGIDLGAPGPATPEPDTRCIHSRTEMPGFPAAACAACCDDGNPCGQCGGPAVGGGTNVDTAAGCTCNAADLATYAGPDATCAVHGEPDLRDKPAAGDTDEMRRRLAADELNVQDIDAIIDALDAARAEADEAKRLLQEHGKREETRLQRAKRAEAQVAALTAPAASDRCRHGAPLYACNAAPAPELAATVDPAKRTEAVAGVKDLMARAWDEGWAAANADRRPNANPYGAAESPTTVAEKVRELAAAKATIARVEALCDEEDEGCDGNAVAILDVENVRAALRGTGDAPAAGGEG